MYTPAVRALVSGLLLLAACAAGCGESSTGEEQVPTGDVQVRMDFTRAGGLYDAPFPSADLQLPDGRVLARSPFG